VVGRRRCFRRCFCRDRRRRLELLLLSFVYPSTTPSQFGFDRREDDGRGRGVDEDDEFNRLPSSSLDVVGVSSTSSISFG